jgi:hypothetical protein
VFLTGKVVAGVDHDQCLLASREALNADECMAFDQRAVEFISKSRDRQVPVRRLRSVVELAKPKIDVPQAPAEVGEQPRLLEPGRCRPQARHGRCRCLELRALSAVQPSVWLDATVTFL